MRALTPGSNQQGQTHWRVLVAHDLYTGLAMRPKWGAMYGDNAVSEQTLLERAVHPLPSGSTVLGDSNFGVVSVARAVHQRGHPLLLRLTIASEPLRDGIDRAMVWRPSRADRELIPICLPMPVSKDV